MVHFDPIQLASWCRGEWRGRPPQFLRGITHDSRAVRGSELYVALRGERLDGHDFVEDARLRAAGAALVEAAYAESASEDFPLLVVDDTGRALVELARSHRARCQAQIVGVTGSVGKTSVKEMAADVLSHMGRVTRTQGNWNNRIGLPLSMLRMEPTDQFGVFEVGMSHPGELAPLCDLLQPDFGIMTPIGPVHIEFFRSVEDIAREKATLLKALPEQGHAVLSLDDPWFEVLREYASSRITLVSMERPEADYYGQWQQENGPLLLVRERQTGSEDRYLMPLPGRYVADNALRAIALGRELGLSADIIAHTIAAYQPLSMRWQIMQREGVQYINDAYNANPMSMRSAIEALQQSRHGDRKWLVVAGMFELGEWEREEHVELGHFIAQFAWAGVVTVGELGGLIASGIADAAVAIPYEVISVDDVGAAAVALQERVQQGDAVLLKASRGEHLERVLDSIQHGGDT